MNIAVEVKATLVLKAKGLPIGRNARNAAIVLDNLFI